MVGKAPYWLVWGTHWPRDVCTSRVMRVEVAGQTQFRASMAYLHSSSHTTWSRTEGPGHHVPCPQPSVHARSCPTPPPGPQHVQLLVAAMFLGWSPAVPRALRFLALPTHLSGAQLRPCHPAAQNTAVPTVSPGPRCHVPGCGADVCCPCSPWCLGAACPPAWGLSAPANFTWNLFSGLRICTYSGQLGAKSFTAQARKMVWWS